jgi:hypothetical protein
MAIVALALGLPTRPRVAGAQQPGKVLQTGFLGNSPASQTRQIETSGRELTDLGMAEGFDGCQTEPVHVKKVLTMTPPVLDGTKGMGGAA